jgi:hypothetical protein
MSDVTSSHNLVPKECSALPQPDFSPPNPLLAEYQSALVDKASKIYPGRADRNGEHIETTTVITSGQSFTATKYQDGRFRIANNTTDQTDYYGADGKTREGSDWLSTQPNGQAKQFRAFFDEKGQLYSEHVLLYKSPLAFRLDRDHPLIDAAYNFEDAKTSFCGEDSPTGLKRILYPKDND